MKTKVQERYELLIKETFTQKLKPLKFKKKKTHFFKDFGETGVLVSLEKHPRRSSSERISFSFGVEVFSWKYWLEVWDFDQKQQKPSFPKYGEGIINLYRDLDLEENSFSKKYHHQGPYIFETDEWPGKAISDRFDEKAFYNCSFDQLKENISQEIEERILPFIHQIDSDDQIAKYLQAQLEEYSPLNVNADSLRQKLFIFYNLLGRKKEAQAMLIQLIHNAKMPRWSDLKKLAKKHDFADFVQTDYLNRLTHLEKIQNT